MALIEGVYLHLPRLDQQHVPIVIASFGAAAILEYNTIESPLAQPRNLVLGHFLAALVGVCITKLFHLLPQSDFEKLRWLAGALSVGAASVLMSVTKTVHPPAGATALLCSTDAAITELGWWLLALILLGAMLMLASALIINNVTRQFPMYWWTPVDLGALQKQRKEAADVEKQVAKVEPNPIAPTTKILSESDTATESDDSALDAKNDKPDLVSAKQERLRRRSIGALQSEVIISGNEIIVPHWFQATDWELNVLQIMQQRLISVSHSEGADPRRSGERKSTGGSGSRRTTSIDRRRRLSSASSERPDEVMRDVVG